MKNVKLLVLAGLLLFVGTYSYCVDLSTCSDDLQESSQCEVVCLDLKNVYVYALNFFDSGDIDSLQMKLDQLVNAKENLGDDYNSERFDNFVNTVKDIMAVNNETLSSEEQEALILALKEAYTSLIEDLCE